MAKKAKVDQLAIDAAAARAASLSYGKWRALQPQTQMNPREQKEQKECYIKRYCPVCGSEFIVSSYSSKKKYCGVACNQRAYKSEKRERANDAK
jgi:hypothetical protein